MNESLVKNVADLKVGSTYYTRLGAAEVAEVKYAGPKDGKHVFTLIKNGDEMNPMSDETVTKEIHTDKKVFESAGGADSALAEIKQMANAYRVNVTKADVEELKQGWTGDTDKDRAAFKTYFTIPVDADENPDYEYHKDYSPEKFNEGNTESARPGTSRINESLMGDTEVSYDVTQKTLTFSEAGNEIAKFEGIDLTENPEFSGETEYNGAKIHFTIEKIDAGYRITAYGDKDGAPDPDNMEVVEQAETEAIVKETPAEEPPVEKINEEDEIMKQIKATQGEVAMTGAGNILESRMPVYKPDPKLRKVNESLSRIRKVNESAPVSTNEALVAKEGEEYDMDWDGRARVVAHKIDGDKVTIKRLDNNGAPAVGDEHEMEMSLEEFTQAINESKTMNESSDDLYTKVVAAIEDIYGIDGNNEQEQSIHTGDLGAVAKQIGAKPEDIHKLLEEKGWAIETEMNESVSDKEWVAGQEMVDKIAGLTDASGMVAHIEKELGAKMSEIVTTDSEEGDFVGQLQTMISGKKLKASAPVAVEAEGFLVKYQTVDVQGVKVVFGDGQGVDEAWVKKADLSKLTSVDLFECATLANRPIYEGLQARIPSVKIFEAQEAALSQTCPTCKGGLQNDQLSVLRCYNKECPEYGLTSQVDQPIDQVNESATDISGAIKQAWPKLDEATAKAVASTLTSADQTGILSKAFSQISDALNINDEAGLQKVVSDVFKIHKQFATADASEAAGKTEKRYRLFVQRGDRPERSHEGTVKELFDKMSYTMEVAKSHGQKVNMNPTTIDQLMKELNKAYDFVEAATYSRTSLRYEPITDAPKPDGDKPDGNKPAVSANESVESIMEGDMKMNESSDDHSAERAKFAKEVCDEYNRLTAPGTGYPHDGAVDNLCKKYNADPAEIEDTLKEGGAKIVSEAASVEPTATHVCTKDWEGECQKGDTGNWDAEEGVMTMMDGKNVGMPLVVSPEILAEYFGPVDKANESEATYDQLTPEQKEMYDRAFKEGQSAEMAMQTALKGDVSESTALKVGDPINVLDGEDSEDGVIAEVISDTELVVTLDVDGENYNAVLKGNQWSISSGNVNEADMTNKIKLAKFQGIANKETESISFPNEHDTKEAVAFLGLDANLIKVNKASIKFLQPAAFKQAVAKIGEASAE